MAQKLPDPVMRKRERDTERQREIEREGEKKRRKEKTLLRKGYLVLFNWGKETEATLCRDLLG